MDSSLDSLLSDTISILIHYLLLESSDTILPRDMPPLDLTHSYVLPLTFIRSVVQFFSSDVNPLPGNSESSEAIDILPPPLFIS